MSADVVTVFVPVDRGRAESLAAGGEALSGHGHAATPALLAAHDLGPADDEDGGYTALGYAGLAALLRAPGLRLVLAADVAAGQVDVDPASPFGEVSVRALRWDQVQALFADEPGALTDLDRARALVAGRDLAAAAEDEEVLALVDGWDLLWYAPQELGDLA